MSVLFALVVVDPIDLVQDSGSMFDYVAFDGLKELETGSFQRGSAQFAVTTIVRDFGDDFEQGLEELADKYLDKRTLLKRMQLLHIAALAEQVNALNAKSTTRVADLIVVTNPAGLTRKDIRQILRKGARVEVVEAGFEMRALWSLGGYKSVFYLRPGMRIKQEQDLGKIWAKMRGSQCAIWGTQAAAQPKKEIDSSLRRRELRINAREDVMDSPASRKLALPPRTVSDTNPAIDLNKMPKLSTPLVDWAKDKNMRPALALMLTPQPSRYAADAAKYTDEAWFRPTSLDECTVGTLAGYAVRSRKCGLGKFVEAIPVENLLAGTPMKGVYPLPIEVAWQKETVMPSAGQLASWLYGQLELSVAKACAKAYQVERMAKVAKEQLLDVSSRPRRPRPRQGRFAHQAMVMKTHILTPRVNQTLHGWAHSVYEEGGEVLAAFQGRHSPETYALFKAEQKRSVETGFELIQLDSDGIVQNTIPFEAPDGFAKACETFYNTLLCQKVGPNATKIIFPREHYSVNRFMWFHTFASSMVIFKHMLDSRPDLEYLWLFDYDVTFTGKLSALFDKVGHDDADMLAVSWQFSNDPKTVLKREAATEDVNMWKGVASFWQPRLRKGRINAGALRLSRRMMQWSLEVAYTPLNWAIDEVFFFDTCERNKPSCKYASFQLYGFLDGSRSFYNYDSVGFEKSLQDNNGRPTYKLRHAVKLANFSASLEPWLLS
ncbi:Hypothetical Protein FCC1311_003862 [Hondaea fermentalgiana]|uniref:Nucleotide-diphospho-sugar transferase domain-containing protein n=1 Tax=Hondaea fermentalgiana TaxID=2315210 RepID=A0A2R5G354_9STRA|nr:Hypothetical Protein FCC1311_003862 [Hondaea fermentalgiana]|eukprot:GBG24168.1 Hypothetical Protein FCC1311_003862 [Hondaea fermentalgiana]